MELTIEQALQQGIAAHKEGKLQDAERLYRAILQSQPTHPDANHNLGIIAVSVNQAEAALPLFKTALEANPKIEQFWLSYLDALIKVQQFEQAKQALLDANKAGVVTETLDRIGEQLMPSGDGKTPSQAQLSSLSECYKSGQYDIAEQFALLLTQEFPSHQFGWKILGALYGQTGRNSEAVNANQTAVELSPQDAEAHYNLGNTLKELGRLDEAEASYTQAIALEPGYAKAHSNLGNTLKDQGKLEEAIGAYNNALAINPDYAEAYNNLGTALHEQGKLEDTIEAYSKAIAIKPDHAETYNNMGVVLKDQGKLAEAIEAFNKALTINPYYAEAYNNMGNALQEQGKLEDTIEAYSKALSIKPDYTDAYYNMGDTLKGLTFKKPNPGLQKIITSLLDKKTYVRPNEIVVSAISLLKFEPSLQKHLSLHPVDEVGRPLQELVAELSELTLLNKLMSICPLPDLELENLFRELRARLLMSISEVSGLAEVLTFQSALALQCFTNEYIYNQSEDEEKALALLEGSVKLVMGNGRQPSPQTILCLASYKPLNHYEWSSSLLATNEIQDVFTRQITEPNQEANFKAVLPVLNDITDQVSSKVREQYEASPYPRWVNLGLRMESASISKMVDEIKLKLFNNKIKEVQSPNILIAGCGTGQHSIGTAARFKGSKTLAIDLSLSSLSYAKRKTEELGIQNIDYMQADILDLCKLSRQFDIVESAGVLHHMDEPFAGWRVLTDCLKPGGLMKVGLYSELARQHIIEMREEISNAGIGSSDAEMKSFRTMVINSNQNHHKRILNSADLYSLSNLKDLLFHVQEHRFNIPKIKEYLAELGLKFCGFEADKIVAHFKLVNAGEDDPCDLDKWQAYEETNPGAFIRMYQFWCQKIA